MLLLTEGRQAGGSLPIDHIRERILQAYASQDRSRGRHVLSLCNDLARYYRTLCIEYKAKADDPDKEWCPRNVKLRHSRKFWYFSSLMAIVHLAEDNPQGDETYGKKLLEAFARPPVQRLFDAVPLDLRGLVGRIAEAYAWFLEFMGDPDRRAGLDKVAHTSRYDLAPDNQFPALKFNSDRMHQDMLTLIDSLPASRRQRILSWFLL